MFKNIFVWLFVISSIYSASAEYPQCRDVITGLPGNCTTKDQCISNREAYNVYGIRRSNCDNYEETCCVNPASGTAKWTETKQKRISALRCNKTNPSELSYLVAIGFLFQGNLDFPCVGALISPDFVITSASCLDFEPHIVQVGYRWNEPGEAIIAYVENYIEHENFDEDTLTNDIALLKLIPPPEIELPYACLWQTDAVYAERLMSFFVQPRTLINPRKKIFATVPLVVTSINVKASSCNNTSKIESKICLANFEDRKSTCLGTGGPVIAKVGNTPYVVAVTSSEFYCFFEGQINATRISHYLDWIENHVWKTNYYLSQQKKFSD